MLYPIIFILVLLWLLGLVFHVLLGGFVHLLLVVAIVVVLFRIFSGRKPF